MTHIPANDLGQRSLGSKDKGEAHGRTGPIALPFVLTWTAVIFANTYRNSRSSPPAATILLKSVQQETKSKFRRWRCYYGKIDRSERVENDEVAAAAAG